MKKIKLTRLFSFLFILLLAWALLEKVPKEIDTQYRETSKVLMTDAANIITNVAMNNAGPDQIDVKSLKRFVSEHLKSREIESQAQEKVKPYPSLKVIAYNNKGEEIYNSNPSSSKKKLNYFAWTDIKIKNKDGKLVGTLSVSKRKSHTTPILEKAKEKVKLVAIIILTALTMLFLFLGSTLHKEIKQNEQTRFNEKLKTEKLNAKLETEKLNAKLKTEKLNAKLKTEIKGREYAEIYIRTIRHEIVNHLTSMDFSAQNMLELKIKDKILTAKINSIIEDINETDELTKRLVELADLEKKNRLENIEKVNVKSFIKEALNDQYIQEKLELKNINIEYKINPKFDINFEKLLAKRAFVNIVNNAADFTLKNSTITIKVSESNTHTNILVLDQGAGLLPDAKDKIFKELCYSTQRPDTGKKSTGLGLHFVKQIMSLHGGKVSLDNNPAGVGAVATLSFPIK